MNYKKVFCAALAAGLGLLAMPAAMADVATDFEALDAGTCIDNLCEFEGLPGVRFLSANVGSLGYVPIFVSDSSSCGAEFCGNNVARGGNVAAGARGFTSQTIRLEFAPAVPFVSIDLTDLDPPDLSRGECLLFGTATIEVLTDAPKIDPVPFNIAGDGDSLTPEHFEFDGDGQLIEEIEITAGFIIDPCIGRGGGNVVGVAEFGLDNLQGGDPILEPPVCARVLPVARGGVGGGSLFGLAISDPDGSGLDTIVLDTTASSLSLTTSPANPLGLFSADFEVDFDGSEVEATGAVVVTDLDGLTCDMTVDFREIDPGDLVDEVICEEEGILFRVTAEDFPGGVTECSIHDLGVTDPELPPAYEEVEECKVLTVVSSISGLVTSDLKVTGTFDPDLKLLFSRFDGVAFGPWADITELNQEIIAIPDPTRLRGKSQWSTVKLCCAKLAIDCNDPSLDGLDDDNDGFPICNGTTPVDCNDQQELVNPAATEFCTNGLDDDCDGAVDLADDDCEPLLVNLESLTVEQVGDAVRLRWRTVSESNNLGFRVVRVGARNKRVMLNPQLIPAIGSEALGADYEYLDTAAPRRGTATYYIEDIDISGVVTRHGPVSLAIRGIKNRARK